jgi:hypothetical protein
MTRTTFDPCLLTCNNKNEEFGVAGIQTDDTLILPDSRFLKMEEFYLAIAKFAAKHRE